MEHVHADGTHVLNALADRVRRERALFGLAFDFDADRGNLTYVDAADRVHIPSPQAAAAINTAIALAVHRRSGDARAPAVVASDATSCRVKQIAAAFGADVVEVETGEIHVVSAMHDLDARGRRAVVGVEGANGGTIFAGTTCRDGALVGAGALLAAADDELRAIIAATLAPGHTLAPGLSGLIDVLPPQRSLSLKYRASADWSKTVDHLERELARVFAAELSQRLGPVRLLLYVHEVRGTGAAGGVGLRLEGSILQARRGSVSVDSRIEDRSRHRADRRRRTGRGLGSGAARSRSASARRRRVTGGPHGRLARDEG